MAVFVLVIKSTYITHTLIYIYCFLYDEWWVLPMLCDCRFAT